jgi:hypothetical protein
MTVTEIFLRSMVDTVGQDVVPRSSRHLVALVSHPRGQAEQGHPVRALCRQVTLNDPGLAPVVGVITPQLIHQHHEKAGTLSKWKENEKIGKAGNKTQGG